jgi:hypothetical protein
MILAHSIVRQDSKSENDIFKAMTLNHRVHAAKMSDIYYHYSSKATTGVRHVQL